MSLLVVSVHDVASATTRSARIWAEALDGCGVPLTFLAVPGPWRGPEFGRGPEGKELASWLRRRQDAGDEIAVHGWFHQADVRAALPRRTVGTLVARGSAELWALDRETATARTQEGVDVLRRNGLLVTGTTPPGWLSSRAARAGLAAAGLQYVTDHAGLLDLATARRWWAPALCHRPAVLPGGGYGAALPGATALALERMGRRVVSVAAQLVSVGRSVRIGLHPDDLERPGLLAGTVEVIRQCLAAGAEATTYAEVLRRLRDEA